MDYLMKFGEAGAVRVNDYFYFCNRGARSAEKILAMLGWVTRFLWHLVHAPRFLATLGWVTRFLWHLARAARRKCFATLGWVARFL